MEQGHQKQISSAGQTLIETLAAVFILSMGMTASVGLAIYALNSSGGIIKQIIATGLAREGLEAVRNMRDTNWLQDTLSVSGCWNFATSKANAANCYKNWLGKNGSGGPPYCINPSPGGSCNGNDSSDTYYLGFIYSDANYWVLNKDNSKFGLSFDPANSGTGGFYSASGKTCTNSSSDYCRTIIITKNPQGNIAPYNQPDIGPLLLVQSQVWWVDKKCPKVDDFNSASVSCRLEMDTYLTNWKNF